MDKLTIKNESGETYCFTVSNGVLGIADIGYIKAGHSIVCQVTGAWWDVHGIAQRPLVWYVINGQRTPGPVQPQAPTAIVAPEAMVVGNFVQSNVDSNGTVVIPSRQDRPFKAASNLSWGGDMITVHNISELDYVCFISNGLFWAEGLRSAALIPAGRSMKMPSGVALWDFHAYPQIFDASICYKFQRDFRGYGVKFSDVNSLATLTLGKNQQTSSVS